MPRIFISYRRDDAAADAGRLADYCREHLGDDQVFIDVETIRVGDDFVDAIERAVASSDVLLVVIGRGWLNATDEAGQRRLDSDRDFVRLEVAAALKRQIRVIPVLVQHASIPPAEDLPADLKDLARRNAVELHATQFRRDVEGLIETLTGASQLHRRRALGRLLGRPLTWVAGAAVLVVLGGWLVATYIILPKKKEPTPVLQTKPERVVERPQELFDLELQVRLSDAFGPVDQAPVMHVWHRAPKSFKTTIEQATLIEDHVYVYEATIFPMPSEGETYEGWLHRGIQHAVKGRPLRTPICFKRNPDASKSTRTVRLWCEEGGECKVTSDDFGWVKVCEKVSGQQSRSWQLVSSAQAQPASQPLEAGWVVPSLETLRKLQEGQDGVAYSKFGLTSGPLPDLREVDRLVYAVRVNGAPIYVDGLPPEADAMPFDASKGLALEFGLENLDFSGKHGGYEDIEVSFQFIQGERLIKQAKAHLRYIALRPMHETEVQAGDDVKIRWKADYHPGRRNDVYQIFLLSTEDKNAVKALEEQKRQIDKANLEIDDRVIVAVMRPPLPDDLTPAYGLALGVRQPTEQVKFTFDDQTSQHLCKGVMRLAAMAANSRLFDNTAYRRNVDNKKDWKPCKQF